MSIKNRTDLNAQVDVLFPDNSTQFITAAKVREHLTDLDDSAINILGDLLIQGKLGYATLLTISSNGDIPHKKYVDDLGALAVHISGTETITGAKTFSSLVTVDTILTGVGSTGSPAIKIGGAATGLFRQDSGGAILKWQLNSVQTLWLGENLGTVAKTAFTAESTVTLSALTASTVPVLNASKELISSGITAAQLETGISLSGSATGTDTYASSLVIAAYQEDRSIFIKFANANTGASTININSLGAKSIVKNGSSALVGGEINAGQIIHLRYDGTNFQII